MTKDAIRALLFEFFTIGRRRALSKKALADVAGLEISAVYRWINQQSLPRSQAILDRITQYVKDNSLQQTQPEPEAQTPLTD